MRFKIFGVTLLAGLLFSAPAGAEDAEAAKAETGESSEAATLLFETPHFGTFSKPTVLRYDFERQAKGEEEGQYQFQVLGDIRDHVDAFRCRHLHELEDQWEYDFIREECTQVEKQNTGTHHGHQNTFFVLVETRRDE